MKPINFKPLAKKILADFPSHQGGHIRLKSDRGKTARKFRDFCFKYIKK
jgi:hypothetical protein